MHWHDAPARGTVLGGRYTLARLIGEGPMGAVYETATPDGKRVAVKVLLELGTRSLGGMPSARFLQEANALGAIRSPHVVELLGVDVDGPTGLAFLVMPLLKGLDLQQRLDRAGPIEPAAAAGIVLQACRGVQAAHQAGFIHRDIKPANLFLEHLEGGRVSVRVLDFGIAKWLGRDAGLTSTGTMLGTMCYMSPEQLKDAKRVDARTDVWALGATLYAALRGTPPFAEVRNLAQLAGELEAREAPALQDAAPWLHPRLAALVHGALLRDREARCPNASELARALEPLARSALSLTAEALAPLADAARRVRAPRAELVRSWTALAAGEDVTSEDTLRDAMTGATLDGRYTLVRLLGAGGMGVVYEACDRDGNRYAIKVIAAERAGTNPAALQRFVREARAVTSLHDEHVVRAFEVGSDAPRGVPFIVMELLHGTDLGRLIARHGALEPAAVARLFVQACRGIGAAHEAGRVHRDIKPANLFLHTLPGGEAVVKVCDFGIAKRVLPGAEGASSTGPSVTGTGGVVGSPRYMSPEQARGSKELDQRSDVWSLGVSLYEALAGVPPWQDREAVGELIIAICTEAVPDIQDQAPWVPTGLAEAVYRCLERDPDARFQSVQELAAAIEPHAGRSQIVKLDEIVCVSDRSRSLVAPRASRPGLGAGRTTTATTVARAMEPPRRRTRAVVAVAALGAAVAAGAVIAGYLRGGSEDRALRPGPSAAATGSAGPAPGAAGRPRVVTATVEIEPSQAEVTVDGKKRELQGGRLALEGAPGQAFTVVLSDGRRRVEGTVVLRSDGTAFPAKMALGGEPEGAGRPPPAPGERTPASGASTTSPAAATGTGTPSPVPTLKPKDEW
ncbi:MAG: protein kinase [Deltaproteobacteria bacterium]|nr:protein kinase [Deltaproteobacteria bacterium]